MKDYASMSDAEINASVAKIMFEVNEGIATPYSHRPDAYIYHLNGLHSVKDYCNNPADAWPIIVENGISLIKCTIASGYWSAEIITDIDEATDNLFQCQSSFDYQDANPLRAAMIVFLKMKEGEND